MEKPYDILLQALAGRFGSLLKTVVLFGSRARGEASPDSDHDIFVVAEDLPANPMARSRQLRGALIACLADLPGAINLHGKTPQEFEADLTPLSLEICVDGILPLWGGLFRASPETSPMRAGNSPYVHRMFTMCSPGGANN
jgi:predicted nucleotidyltransferase